MPSDVGGDLSKGVKCLSLVMEALVEYSEGSGKQKVFPYEGGSGSSTTAFLNIPTGALACTVSRMYPFAVNAEKEWKRLQKIKLYPFPQIWPRTVMKRFLKFNDGVHERYDQMKKSYQESGGTYHGDSDEEKEAEVDADTLEEKKADVELDCDKFF